MKTMMQSSSDQPSAERTMKKKLSTVKRKTLSALISAVMLFALMVPAQEASAQTTTLTPDGSGIISITANGDYYISGVGATITTIKVDSGVTANVTIENVTAEATEYKSAFSVDGGATVNLTLKGNNKLQGGTSNAGLQVLEGGTLIITSNSDGTLTSKGGTSAPGIGGKAAQTSGTIMINGGTIIANGGNSSAGIGAGWTGIGGTIMIKGGNVTANGNNAAGIGGGNLGSGGNITITGGIVTATGGLNNPGIGNGYGYTGDKQNNITISGGIVNATGNKGAAGIGGAVYSNSSNITISGGTVNAATLESTAGAYAIGKATNAKSEGTTVIDGGSINAATISNMTNSNGEVLTLHTYTTISKNAAGMASIKSGLEFPCSTDAEGKLYLWLPASFDTYFIGDGFYYDLDSSLSPASDKSVIDLSKSNVIVGENYVKGKDADGNVVKPNSTGYKIMCSEATTTNTISVNSGTHNITLSGVNIDVSNIDETSAFSLTSNAIVNLTLDGMNALKSGNHCAGLQVPDGAKLTINGALDDKLTVTGGNYSAGIGGGYLSNSGTINVLGGRINANGGFKGAGIGGGYNTTAVSTINIKDGYITATGGIGGAGIGGGYFSKDAKITITGGTVNATGKSNITGAAADIGNGEEGFQTSAVVIKGGSVNANNINYFNPTRTKQIISTNYGANKEVTISYNGGDTFNCVTDSEGKLYFWLPTGVNSWEDGKNVFLVKTGDSYNNNTNYGLINLHDGAATIGNSDVSYGGSSQTPNSNGYIITCSDATTPNRVTVTSGEHKLLLWNVNIDVTEDYACAFDVYSNAKVNMVLIGDNTLKSKKNQAGLSVPSGAEVTINGTENDSLTATGGYYGAGIGGGNEIPGGTVSIKGGTITAKAGDYAAGIGGGSNAAGGTVNVSGGTVTATGGASGAGIGGGNFKAGGTFNISGGTATAIAGSGSYGFGPGEGYNDNSKGSISVNGDAVIYASSINANSKNITKGIVYLGGTLSGTTKDGGVGTVYGNPNRTDFVQPSGAVLGTDLSEINVEGSGVTAVIPDVTYTGSEVSPTATVAVNKIALAKTLTLGTDYKIEVTESDKVNVGSKTALISAVENSGNINSKSASFKIIEKAADEGNTTLYGHSLSLKGNIEVNFYMQLTESDIADTGAYMQMTLGGKPLPPIYVKDITPTVENGKTYYVFTCQVNSNQLKSEITAQLVRTGGATGKLYTYSVNDYATSLLSRDDAQVTAAKPLIKAMSAYGSYATTYFDSAPLDVTSEANNAVAAVTKDNVSSYACSTSGSLAPGLTYYGSSLLLESKTTIRHYFAVSEGHNIDDYTFLLDGAKLTPVAKNGFYYIDITDIASNQLGKMFTVTIGDFSINYSAMSYVYLALNGGTPNENLSNLMKALYLYYQQADLYFNKN